MPPHRGGSPQACRDEAALNIHEVIDNLERERQAIIRDLADNADRTRARVRAIDASIHTLQAAGTELGNANRMQDTYRGVTA